MPLKTAAPAPKVSIVILNWNGYAVTRDCLESLSRLDYPNSEVLLVDNGSHDGSPDRLASEFPAFRVIRNPKNLGFTGGNNVGICHALQRGADYVLLLNNDTVVDHAFLSRLIEAGESDARIGALNPKIYYYEPPRKIWYAGGSFSFWFGIARHIGGRKLDQGRWDEPKQVSFITGCAFLIKSSVVRQVGLLDDTFFYSCEDTDWTIRALRAGYKCMYVPSAVLWHKESFDVKKNAGRAFRDYYNARNGLLLARKHARWYQWPTFLLCYAQMIAYRTAGYSVRREWERVTALYKGIWSGCLTVLTKEENFEFRP